MFAMSGAKETGTREQADLRISDEGVGSKSIDRRPRSGPQFSALEREILGYSVREVRDALPGLEARNMFMFHASEEVTRVRLLFRRLGALEGEAGLDEIVRRYGAGNFTGTAMSEAIIGWSNVDEAAALAAFRELLRSDGAARAGFLEAMSWKGASVLSGFG